MILPTVIFSIGTGASEPSNSSTKTCSLNLSGFCDANAIMGSRIVGGGSSAGFREECSKVNRVTDVEGDLEMTLLNN